MNEAGLTALRELLGTENVLVNEPMSAHTSMRVGGPADLLVRVSGAAQLRRVLELLAEENTPYYLLGRGTNLLVGDGGYRGCMICLSETGAAFHGTEVTVPAGETLAALAAAAGERGLAGLEFASGIPGTVGGAVAMNAGAYGGSMDQIVVSAELFLPDGSVCEVSAGELHFGYRHSLLKEISAVVLRVRLRLEPGDPAAIRAGMQALAAQRRQKQPLEYPSAGSTFKRPEGFYAGKLIMEAGLRGFSVGGAAVSEKHCGFVINRDHATAADVRAVIRGVRTRVHEETGIWLEEEVISLGDFPLP